MWYAVNDNLAINSLFFNFLPSWWNKNYGITFGEPYVFNPDYRVELSRYMERTVNQRFPELRIGSPDPQPQVILPDFGNAITPAGAGCDVDYPEDNYPWNQHLPEEQMLQLSVPDNIAGVFPYNEITRQVQYLNCKLGKDTKPILNPRGVLNDAILIGGSRFFSEFIDDSPLAQRLLAYSFGILKSTIRYNHQVLGESGMVMLTNCAVMMINPNLYQAKFLPYDQELHQLVTANGQPFGIHHCGNFERYAPSYRQLPKVDWIETGWGSDIKTTLKLFPEATIQYIFSAVFVSKATRSQVHQRVCEILEAARGNWHRFRLSMPDIEYGTPDENLVEIMKTCKEGLVTHHE